MELAFCRAYKKSLENLPAWGILDGETELWPAGRRLVAHIPFSKQCPLKDQETIFTLAEIAGFSVPLASPAFIHKWCMKCSRVPPKIYKFF